MAEIIYKKLGETSFQAIERLRSEKPELSNERLSFAGRLDPMAEGYMLILIGDENDNREKFLGLNKKYKSEFLLGISTDSFDLMGKIVEIKECQIEGDELKKKIESELKRFVGKQNQKFPPFSKKHVKGQALFVWASQGRLDEIEIPEHEIEIYDIQILANGKRRLSEIAREAIDRIFKVNGDFRQEEIISGWEKYLSDEKEMPTVSVEISCSTGTYIRQLAEDFGQKMGCGACVYSIERTSIEGFI